MATFVKLPRGTRANLTSLGGSSGLVPFSKYWVTDEQRFVMALSSSTMVDIPAIGQSNTWGGTQTFLNATLTGKLTTAASAVDASGFVLPHGSAPTSPNNGDMWTTTSGVYARINGATVGPFGAGGADTLGSDGNKGDITVGGTGTTLTINANSVTSANMRQSAALSIIGNTTNATANVTDIAAGADFNIMRRSGTAIGFGAIDLSQAGAVGTSRLTAANFIQGSALSVMGVTGNATANIAAIAAGTDGHVLRRSGTTLGFGTITGDGIASDTVSNTNLAVMPTMTLKGNNTGGSTGPLDLTITQATAMINPFSTTLKGAVPAGNSNKQYLRSDATWQDDVRSITFVIDGGGAAITTGLKGFLEIPFACTIQQWTLLADVSGSAVVDIWKDTYANFPPVIGDVITASAKPTLSSAQKNQSATLTGWTTTVAAGDILAFNVNSAATVTKLTLSLKVKVD